ncbi:MAG TPA: cobyrinate a,c-diamide synthase, partial [Burkholderiaceae bacterium]
RGIPLLGRLCKQESALPERHLGLLPPAEVGNLDSLIESMAAQLVLDEEAWHALPRVSFLAPDTAVPPPLLDGRRIAIARDAAFAFLHPANLECLRQLGADLLFFSPLADEPIPAGANAVYLPGGYPELHAQTLAGAARWKQSVCDAHARAIPIWAECGGMMALCDGLVDLDGVRWNMAGLLPGEVHMQNRLTGLGPQGLATRFGVWRGHTFHYSRLETAHAPRIQANRHPSGGAGEGVYVHGSLSTSYFHAYFPSCAGATAAVFSGLALFAEAP